MIIKYNVTVDDFVAFNRYHSAHSPTFKRTKWMTMLVGSAVIIGGSFLVPANEEVSRSIILFGFVIFAVIFSVMFSNRFQDSVDRSARRLYSEGTNRGTFGPHEIEIDDNGLIERTDVNETRYSWKGIERIAETDDHVFIYISAMMAHVIPKKSIVGGDSVAFVIRVKQLLFEHNPDAKADQNE